MGIFGFLKKSPAAVLDKARRLLAQGSARDALQRLDQLLADGAAELRAETLALRHEAFEKVIETALERAKQAEEAGYLDDAAQWVESAYELVRGESGDGESNARAAALEIHLATLRQRADEKHEAAAEKIEFGQSSDPFSFQETDPDALYDILCDMQSEPIAALYRGRSGTFRRAVVDLNDGNGEEALTSLEVLVSEAEATEQGPDAILFLERGRARMLTGDPHGAREDFAHAWDELGEVALDHSGELSVPTLWAEAALEVGDSAAVAERLAPLADQTTASPPLIELYGTSLEQQERLQEARDLWWGAVSQYPGKITFSRHLAGVLIQLGEAHRAIDCLEAAIAPSCRTGNCSTPPKDLPTFRQLVGLYLDSETLDTQRAGELLEQISLAQRGSLTRPDVELSISYCRATDKLEAAVELEHVLEQLALEGTDLGEGSDGSEGNDALVPDLTDQKRAAL